MGKKILVVDDQKTTTDLFSLILTKAGYDTDVASGGKEALDKLKKNKADLVLLDLMMPHMSGLDVLAEIRKDSKMKGCKVAIITALGMAETEKKEVIKKGANGFIEKPVEKAKLLAEVKKLLT